MASQWTFVLLLAALSSVCARRSVQFVRRPGCSEKLPWSREADALVIKLPAKLPTTHAATFQIGF